VTSGEWSQVNFYTNTVLFGHDATPRLIAFEMEGQDQVRIFAKKNGQVTSTVAPFTPFLLLLLSSGEHPETILLNTLFNTFLFSCYTEVSSEWVLKRKNKTCGLVEFTMKPDSIAIEAIEEHHFLIFNISY